MNYAEKARNIAFGADRVEPFEADELAEIDLISNQPKTLAKWIKGSFAFSSFVCEIRCTELFERFNLMLYLGFRVNS